MEDTLLDPTIDMTDLRELEDCEITSLIEGELMERALTYLAKTSTNRRRQHRRIIYRLAALAKNKQINSLWLSEKIQEILELGIFLYGSKFQPGRIYKKIAPLLKSNPHYKPIFKKLIKPPPPHSKIPPILSP